RRREQGLARPGTRTRQRGNQSSPSRETRRTIPWPWGGGPVTAAARSATTEKPVPVQQQRSNGGQRSAVAKGTVHDLQGRLMVHVVAPTVLIVDDDRDIREALTQALVEGGYTAVGVANGQEALRWLRTATPAPCLILLDLAMPVMNGWQFRSEQQRDPGLAAIP